MSDTSSSITSHCPLLPSATMLSLFNYVTAKVKRVADVAALTAFATFWVMLPVHSIVFPFVFLATSWWMCTVGFFFVYLFWHRATSSLPSKGGVAINFFRGCWPWRTIRNYFKHKIVKTAELPSDRNYIMGSHPHGVLAIGATLTFAAKVSGFHKIFPGLDPCILVLDGIFSWPFLRECAAVIGAKRASGDSLKYLLNNPGKGRAIGIVIGGLNESLTARQGLYYIKLKERKGFIRHALASGASLVPCFHFGEMQLYDQVSGSDEGRLKNMIARIRNITGFFPPLLTGKSVFGLPTGGLLPYERPVTTVIGAPIDVDKVEEPTEEEIDKLHGKYCKALEELFEEHKLNYGIEPETHLQLY